MALDTVAAGLYSPSNSVGGSLAAAASPAAAQQIGDYFKNLAAENPNGKLNSEQQTAHILAYGILAAATAAAGGNDALSAGIAAGTAEAAAPKVAKWLYGTDDSNKLSAEQKATVSSITGLGGAAVGAVGGSNTADVVSGSQVAQNAVENNWLSAKEVNRLVELDRACSKGAGKACKGYLDLRKLDQERDLRLLAACQQPSSAACRNLKAQANIANASLASGYFDPVLHPELWSDKEKASAHKKEYSDTDAVLRLSEGWTPEQIMREAALLNATRTVLADLTIVGTIKDFKEADTLADYATAIILAAPGLKQADTLKHAGDFTRAYKAAKEAGDLKAAKEIIELARTAEKSPNNLAKLAQKEQAIVSGRAISAEGQSLLQSAEAPFKGQPLTNAGRATTKHPEYFGFNSTDELRAVYRTDAQLNDTNSTKYNTIEPKPKLPQTPPCPN
ncbi:VENN motif pre-toxin domain-containing protein [Paralysiella testudinis]|uniref:VENN motif pre-toxin domain-containing protein n=2 Tax=Paralysiella testudinis TaxID=2809020 RepID=A0A892ZE70_9NEIS|nr:VENN motif pre-toxin domain-containing protein [Paralysiella testudinis]QRQ80920.1 VENN motif pre-toxin domain-containing protein [Paralysiella testudinis]